MENIKIYIGGKVSGLTPEEFHSKFNSAKDTVKKRYPNAEILVPVDLCDDNWGWEHCMDVCLDALWTCDVLYLMPDWKDSKGSFIEKKVAEKLGIKVLYL